MSSSRPGTSTSGRGQKTLPATPIPPRKANRRPTESLRSAKSDKSRRHVLAPALKRGRGRPPKLQAPPPSAPPLAIVPPPVPSISPARVLPEEPKKKIANCVSPLGRQTRQPPPRGRRGGRPVLVRPPRDESESEDDIPPCFSDVVKIIQKKVKETQAEITRIDESFCNYKKAHEADTNFAMKFYAAIPLLHARVEAGATFDDDLLESVFTELFPTNGDSKKQKQRPAVDSTIKGPDKPDKTSATKKRSHSTTDDTSSDNEEPTGSARLRRSSLKNK